MKITSSKKKTAKSFFKLFFTICVLFPCHLQQYKLCFTNLKNQNKSEQDLRTTTPKTTSSRSTS